MTRNIFIVAGNKRSADHAIDLLGGVVGPPDEIVVVDDVRQIDGPAAIKDGDYLMRMPGWSAHPQWAVMHTLVDDDELEGRGVRVQDLPLEFDPDVLQDTALLKAWLSEG